MVTADAGLIEVTVNGRRYLGIPIEHAHPASACIRSWLSLLARKSGAGLPVEVPLWALALQLEVASRSVTGSDPGTEVSQPRAEPALSTHDVSKQLHVSTRYVRAAADAGTLLGTKVGHFWTFRQGDVHAFAEQRTAR